MNHVTAMPTYDQFEHNPFAAPQATEAEEELPAPNVSEAIRIRRQRHKQEETLRQRMLALTGLFTLFSAISILVAAGFMGPQSSFLNLAIAIGFTAAAGISVFVNWGVRRFAAWTRLPLTVLATIALPLFPLGTACAVPILFSIHSGDEPRLLTLEYEHIVRATPKLNQRTNWMTWLALILMIILAISIYLVAQIPPEIRHAR